MLTNCVLLAEPRIARAHSLAWLLRRRARAPRRALVASDLTPGWAHSDAEGCAAIGLQRDHQPFLFILAACGIADKGAAFLSLMDPRRWGWGLIAALNA